MNYEKGFTLIELICVLAILSILTLIVVPSTNIYRVYELRHYMQILQQDVRAIKLQDMAGNRGYLIVSQNYYKIYNDKCKLERKVKLPRNFEFEKNLKNSRVEFTFGGQPCYAGRIELIDQKTGESKVLTIMPYTGNISVYD